MTYDISSTTYLMDDPVKSKNVKQELDNIYQQAATPNQVFWREALVDMRFAAGDQRVFADIYGSKSFNKKQFYFNRMMRIRNMIAGYQRQHRKSTVVTGRESADDKTAGQLSRCVFFANQLMDFSSCLSDAFQQGAVEAGRSWMSFYLDFSNDPSSGDIKCQNIGPLSVLVDPFYRKQDLSDCNYIWRRQWLSQDQACRYLPGREKDIKRMKPKNNRDGKFELQAQNYNFAIDSLYKIDEYYYLSSRDQIILMDLETGESIEYNGEEEDEELRQFLEMYPSIVKHDGICQTVEMCILINDQLMYRGPTSLGIDRYPLVPVVGYYNPDLPYSSNRCQGVLRNLRDSQFLYNRRKVVELDILESQVNSGFIYKPTSLVNPNDVYLNGQGKGIPLHQGAEMTDIREIQPPQIPPTMIQLSELLGREIMEISGVNEELLGSADDDKAGILSMLRQGAGLTTLQILFDQLDISQKIAGQVVLESIQKNWKKGKVKRILGEEPTPQFFNNGFAKYDCVIEEGVNTATQRQMAFLQHLHLRELGIPVPSEDLIDLASVQDADKLKEKIMQAEQQQAQMEQQKQQVEMALVQKQIEKTDAESLAMSGYGLKHMADIRKIDSEIIENRSQAIERVEQAKLDKVKAITEIADMELDQIQRMIDLYNAIEVNETGEAALPPQGQTVDSFNMSPS